jgi:hypothetical protein
MDGLVKATSQMRIDSFIMASGPIDEPEQQEQPSEEPERWGGVGRGGESIKHLYIPHGPSLTVSENEASS